MQTQKRKHATRKCASHFSDSRALFCAPLSLRLGTGRSGSVSLWRLLRQQHGTLPAWMTHESKPLLPWTIPANTTAAAEATARLALLARRAEHTDLHSAAARAARHPAAPADARTFVGDVASSYLPYAQALLNASPCVILLILERSKEDVVRSWLAKSGDADFWRVRRSGGISGGGGAAISDAAMQALMAEVDADGNATAAAKVARAEAYWGGLFPKYGAAEGAGSKEDAIRCVRPYCAYCAFLIAPLLDFLIIPFIDFSLFAYSLLIRLYWEEYARRGAALALAYPTRARVFPSPQVLSDTALQRSLLAFAGFASPRPRPSRRYNCAASCPPPARTPGELAAAILAKRLAAAGGTPGAGGTHPELWRKAPMEQAQPRAGPPGPLPMRPQWPDG
jgi:hypothetical protein